MCRRIDTLFAKRKSINVLSVDQSCNYSVHINLDILTYTYKQVNTIPVFRMQS